MHTRLSAVPPRKNSAKTAELQAVEDEGGRDSGLWTSSNSEYDQVEDWRKHIKNPPPGILYTYTYLGGYTS